jgi:hypothetical protein
MSRSVRLYLVDSRRCSSLATLNKNATTITPRRRHAEIPRRDRRQFGSAKYHSRSPKFPVRGTWSQLTLPCYLDARNFGSPRVALENRFPYSPTA